jgi:hypothetical protein
MTCLSIYLQYWICRSNAIEEETFHVKTHWICNRCAYSTIRICVKELNYSISTATILVMLSTAADFCDRFFNSPTVFRTDNKLLRALWYKFFHFFASIAYTDCYPVPVSSMSHSVSFQKVARCCSGPDSQRCRAVSSDQQLQQTFYVGLFRIATAGCVSAGSNKIADCRR